MAGVVGKLLKQLSGLKKGESANVGTSSYSVPYTITGSAVTPVRADDIPIQGVVRLTTDTDCFYRLDGEDATLLEPSIPLTAGVERYESIRTGNLPDETKGFSVIGTAGTLNIDIIV